MERVVPVRKLSRDEVLPEVRRLDLLILGGGGILFDGEAQIFLREVMLAHEHRVPVMVYAVSAGPLRDPAAQDAVREALAQAEVVTRARARRAPGARGDRGAWRDRGHRGPGLAAEAGASARGRAEAGRPGQRAAAGRHVGARARRRRPRDQRAGLSPAAGRCRRLHGRPLRRGHRVRADGAERCSTPSRATRSPRRCCARRARRCSRATIPRRSC